MKIRVLFFGILKDLGIPADESLALPEGALVRDVLTHFGREVPRFAEMIPALAISVNRQYAERDRVLQDGDEVAFLPPVSGGSAEDGPTRGDVPIQVQLVRDAIDTQAVIAQLKQAADGAVVIFDGVVRDNTRGRRTLYLDYEAYEAMAVAQMETLAVEARERFAVRAAAIIHRLGRLQIGETSVLIAAAAVHRGAAFEACRWMIDTLKKTVPIWKKEYFVDGAVWADGEPFPEEIRLPEGTTGKQPAS
jgi:molybdopterin synthase catalytic subunit